jgi:Fe-Mn family superoxide dismutase
MESQKLYTLPELDYRYDALVPFISEDLLRVHHTKHHTAYVEGANAILRKMDEAKIKLTDFDAKATFKDLSFQVGGHLLHSLFWKNLAPAGKGGGDLPTGNVAKIIQEEYGSVERFKKIFSQTAMSAEGSGWAALTFCQRTQRPMIMQVEKHNVNIYPTFKILMVLDVWEHAYYLDYKNERGRFLEAFWNVVNWSEVDKRLEGLSEAKAGPSQI